MEEWKDEICRQMSTVLEQLEIEEMRSEVLNKD